MSGKSNESQMELLKAAANVFQRGWEDFKGPEDKKKGWIGNKSVHSSIAKDENVSNARQGLKAFIDTLKESSQQDIKAFQESDHPAFKDIQQFVSMRSPSLGRKMIPFDTRASEFLNSWNTVNQEQKEKLFKMTKKAISKSQDIKGAQTYKQGIQLLKDLKSMKAEAFKGFAAELGEQKEQLVEFAKSAKFTVLAKEIENGTRLGAIDKIREKLAQFTGHGRKEKDNRTKAQKLVGETGIVPMMDNPLRKNSTDTVSRGSNSTRSNSTRSNSTTSRNSRGFEGF